ncbi:putative invertase inhibitor [Tasmannia lanceolata]|uniref:putative invertase inhibitor n=1 Tax=Tasmannia lanceolata TaxID=3420 RepID=UPI004064AF81
MDTSADLVDKICKQTKDQNNCVQALNSDPRTKTADLKGLAHIALDLANKSASDTREYIGGLISNTSDAVMEQYLNGCLDDYAAGLFGIQKANTDLNSGAYNPLRIDMGAVGHETINCQNRFNFEPFRDCPVTDRNQNLFNLCDISEATASLLGGLVQ